MRESTAISFWNSYPPVGGGTGSDVLSHGESCEIYAESEGVMEILINTRETAVGINERGDLVTGGAGSVENDSL